MPSQNKKGRRTFSTSQPYRIHIENETKLMPVFTVYPNQYEAALKRYPDLAKIVKTTWGIDGDVWNTAIKDADALIGYRFPRENLAHRAPNLELVQVLGAGVDYMLPFDWVPKDLVLTTNCGAHVPKGLAVGAYGDPDGKCTVTEASHRPNDGGNGCVFSHRLSLEKPF